MKEARFAITSLIASAPGILSSGTGVFAVVMISEREPNLLNFIGPGPLLMPWPRKLPHSSGYWFLCLPDC
jgi:hypothetical protein